MAALSDIIFPSQEPSINTNNINKILGDLKRSNLSITNRLRSIQEDADFVEEAAAALAGGLSVGGAGSDGGDDDQSSTKTRRPLVANERCGSWYIRPGLKGASAYFKSTDGHTGQWKFSTRRLNLHLLPIIERCDGIIIVDSTRRGKRMPDSLSKTVPTWCCVLNRTLFPELTACHGLYVPPNVVSDSEKSQMLARVPGFVDSLKQLNLDLASLRAQITKPIRPTWVTQETDLSKNHDDDDDDDSKGQIFESYRPVICCTSSRRITDGEMSGHSGYVQGAGDDTENWALGLTPPVFWAHAEQLLSAPEADLPELIRSLVASASHTAPTTATTNSTDAAAATHSLPPGVTRLTPFLHVSPIPVPQPLPRQDAQGAPQTWFKITIRSTPTPPETWAKSPAHMEVGLGRHKAASRSLRTALPRICELAYRFLLLLPPLPPTPQQPAPEQGQRQGAPASSSPLQPRILVADETEGRDLAAGVALALLCWCFGDDDGRGVRGGGGPPHERVERPVFSKDLVRARLGRIMTAMPDANPNRATLQSVNSFLMDWK
ncbi:tRNA A64-2'-O-ribosylphosphate transferase [Diaporthe australafricana]|uniref:tRNA A64-2'-O-ribosylphosphate transferase n=1 Tax=Diaporthe australafricana TaxID=127596 RepID=A0ABR3WX67_9PEZI